RRRGRRPRLAARRRRARTPHQPRAPLRVAATRGADRVPHSELRIRAMPYTPILATLGYVFSPDGARVLMIHRNARPADPHFGKYNGLGGKLDPGEDVVAGLRREVREEAGIE